MKTKEELAGEKIRRRDLLSSLINSVEYKADDLMLDSAAVRVVLARLVKHFEPRKRRAK